MNTIIPATENQASHLFAQFILRAVAALMTAGLSVMLMTGMAVAETPAIPEITPAVAASNAELVQQRAALLQERAALRARAAMNKSECQAVKEKSAAEASCIESSSAISTDVDRHIQATKQFITNLDTMTVDTRGISRDGAYLTDQVPELKNSPAADRISKGFQAVMNHDWLVALAWWQDALNRDPNNAALKRSVDLAKWMVDRRKEKTAGPVTPLGAAIYSATHGDNAEAIRQFELVKKENPAIVVQVDNMINELRQRQQTKDDQAEYWSSEIKKGTQEMVDLMFESGMNMLSIGDEKGAQNSFNDATFFGMPGGVLPSQMSEPSPKTR